MHKFLFIILPKFNLHILSLGSVSIINAVLSKMKAD